MVASLVFGLGENSRIKRKIAGQKLTLEQIILVRIYDEVAWLKWAQTKDGQHGTNRPEPLLQKLLQSDKKENEYNGYASGDDFQKAWQEITGGH